MTFTETGSSFDLFDLNGIPLFLALLALSFLLGLLLLGNLHKFLFNQVEFDLLSFIVLFFDLTEVHSYRFLFGFELPLVLRDIELGGHLYFLGLIKLFVRIGDG